MEFFKRVLDAHVHVVILKLRQPAAEDDVSVFFGFLICYADNLTDADLTSFRRFHEEHGVLLTMALFHTNVSEQCGIAELDAEGRIVEFVEKPKHPKSNLANAGMYIADRRIFDFLDPVKTPLDFGNDVLPKLVGQMAGWNTEGYLIDIGTLENYKRAKAEWTGHIK